VIREVGYLGLVQGPQVAPGDRRVDADRQGSPCDVAEQGELAGVGAVGEAIAARREVGRNDEAGDDPQGLESLASRVGQRELTHRDPQPPFPVFQEGAVRPGRAVRQQLGAAGVADERR
jgi:hypothetical protein